MTIKMKPAQLGGTDSLVVPSQRSQSTGNPAPTPPIRIILDNGKIAQQIDQSRVIFDLRASRMFVLRTFPGSTSSCFQPCVGVLLIW